MLVSNDPQGRWVNGSLGRVRGVRDGERGEPVVEVELEEGEAVEVGPHTWELYELYLDRGELRSRVVGRYLQLPLILGWAVTIHKAQGKTFSRVVVDLGRGAFAPGQVYVALSRCTSLEGLVLKRPLSRRHIFSDRRVAEFLAAFQYRRAEAVLPLEERRRLAELAIREGRAHFPPGPGAAHGGGVIGRTRLLSGGAGEEETPGERGLRPSGAGQGPREKSGKA